jgi:hypothetical protein
MEEWLTAHEESLNSVEVNTSEDTKNSVKQEPNFEHGESSSTTFVITIVFLRVPLCSHREHDEGQE